MEKEIKELFRAMKEQKTVGMENEHPFLETIWKYHAVHSSVTDESIQKKINMIMPHLKTLSQKKKRIIMARIVDLCVEHERAAFMEGIRVGGRLMMEIKEEDIDSQQKMP